MADPAWLTALIDQRIAELEHKAADLINDPQLQLGIVMTPLKDPVEDTKLALDYWERACDNCGRYCPDNEQFFTGHRQRTLSNGLPVVLLFGVCASCKWD